MAAPSRPSTRQFGSSDDTSASIRVWDLDTGHQVGPPLPTSGTPFAVSFSPDGRRLVTVTDRAVELWDSIFWTADGERLRRTVCRGLGRDLSRAEWRIFVPDTPYRRTCSR